MRRVRARLAREREDDVLHEGEDGEPVDGSGEIGANVKEPDFPAQEVVDGGDGKGDEVVQRDAEDGGGNASEEGTGAEQAAGYGVRDSVERGSRDSKEGDGKREIKSSGGQPGD